MNASHKSSLCMLLLIAAAGLSALTGCGKASEPAAENDVDVDLTKLSSTMIYAEVNNMITNPEQYEGKTVRMRGTFDLVEDADSETFSYTCVIADATACCSQGILFVRDGDYQFPEDYPEIWSEITVKGTFDVYESGGYKICQLVHSTLETETNV